MSCGDNPNTHRKPRLRAVFIGCAILGVAIGIKVYDFRRHEDAIARLNELGAAVSYDYQWTQQEEWKLGAVLPGDWRLQYLLGEHYAASPVEVQLFVGPSMRPERFTDDDAAVLSSLSRVKWLVLQDTKLSDIGLMRLADISSLERLDIEGTLVTPDGVNQFQAARPKVNVSY